jgi:hypothetical protein
MNTEIISRVKEPFPYLKIENFYTENELTGIWQELNFLTYKHKLQPPEMCGTAYDENNNPQKRNRGLFLDQIYSNRDISNILVINRKIFQLDYLKLYSNLNFGYRNILFANNDSTLISYYEDGDHYKPHHDNSSHTALTWFFKEPQKFEGGNLFFPEFDYTIEIKNNMLVMFPGFLIHQVFEIKMENNIEFSGDGRYCMSQFISSNY